MVLGSAATRPLCRYEWCDPIEGFENERIESVMRPRDEFNELVIRCIERYCRSHGPGFDPDNFDWSSAEDISDFDVNWVLRGVREGLFEFSDREFLWTSGPGKFYVINAGPSADSPRRPRLARESWITLACASRLVLEFDWSPESIAPEYDSGTFDILVLRDGIPYVACEMKLGSSTLDKMTKFLSERSGRSPYTSKPEGNHERKLWGLQQEPYRYFWAVAEAGHEKLFAVERIGVGLSLEARKISELRRPT